MNHHLIKSTISTNKGYNLPLFECPGVLNKEAITVQGVVSLFHSQLGEVLDQPKIRRWTLEIDQSQWFSEKSIDQELKQDIVDWLAFHLYGPLNKGKQLIVRPIAVPDIYATTNGRQVPLFTRSFKDAQGVVHSRKVALALAPSAINPVQMGLPQEYTTRFCYLEASCRDRISDPPVAAITGLVLQWLQEVLFNPFNLTSPSSHFTQLHLHKDVISYEVPHPSGKVFYHYGSQDKHNEQHFAEEQHYPHYFHTPAGRVCDHHGGADSYAAPMLWSRNVYAHDQTQATPSH